MRGRVTEKKVVQRRTNQRVNGHFRRYGGHFEFYCLGCSGNKLHNSSLKQICTRLKNNSAAMLYCSFLGLG